MCFLTHGLRVHLPRLKSRQTWFAGLYTPFDGMALWTCELKVEKDESVPLFFHEFWPPLLTETSSGRKQLRTIWSNDLHLKHDLGFGRIVSLLKTSIVNSESAISKDHDLVIDNLMRCRMSYVDTADHVCNASFL
jgi:hypothetical protein